MIVPVEDDTKTPAEAGLQFFAAELPAPLLRLALNGRSAGVVVTSEMVSVNTSSINGAGNGLVEATVIALSPNKTRRPRPCSTLYSHFSPFCGEATPPLITT